MIALPNPNSKMTLTQEQYDHILEQYVELVVDAMTYEELYLYTYEGTEDCIRTHYPEPVQLLNEIESTFDKELVKTLLKSVGK